MRVFYTAFRRFVESSEYHPERYERLRNGETMTLRPGSELTEDELIGQLLASAGKEAERLGVVMTEEPGLPTAGVGLRHLSG